MLFPLLIPALGRLSKQALGAAMLLLWGAALLVPGLFLLFGPLLGPDSANFLLLRNAVYFTPILHLPQFLIGAATGILFGSQKDLAQPAAARLWPGFAWTALAVLIFAFSLLKLDYGLVNNGLFAPLFALILYTLAVDHGPVQQALSSRGLVLLGEASFAIYILQYPLASWLSQLRGRSWGAAALSLEWLALFTAALVLVSIASFLLFETPMRRKLLNFTKPRP